MRTWFTVTEAAEYAGVSRDTIYAACERHEMRHARVSGRRAIRVRPEWIDGWLEQHARAVRVQPSAGSSNAGAAS
jgi:excisionase family DNA binding protein